MGNRPECRVLLLPATRRDAEVTQEILQRAQLDCVVCQDVTELVAAGHDAVGVILLTDAAFHDANIRALSSLWEKQPPWSDIPAVLLCRSGHGSAIADEVIALMSNVTVLERPATIRTLISSLKAALRARQRQYDMRDQFKDLTSSEAALKEVSADLQDSNRRKDEFLAMLAHELRNPLAPIQNANEVLARQISDPQLKGVVSLVRRQLTHMTRLVDDLLDVSRITQGRIELRRTSLSVAEILNQAREAVEPHMNDKGHHLVVDSGTEVLHVNGDHARLVQSISNILINAAKYTDRGGEIRLQARRQAVEAVITVTDNGIGIAKELLPRLFDLFVQGDRSLARSQGGLGIGLSLVKRLVEMHGGQVSAHSEGPGLGSAFELRLPLVETPHPLPPEIQVEKCAAKRILVVDDNEDAANSLAVILELEGHSVDIVYTGRDALTHAHANRPDVILLDLGLPDMSGYEVVQALRPMLTSTQIVALTGYGHAEDIRRARDVGFDAHVVKPVDFDDLTEILGSFDPDVRNFAQPSGREHRSKTG